MHHARRYFPLSNTVCCFYKIYIPFDDQIGGVNDHGSPGPHRLKRDYCGRRNQKFRPEIPLPSFRSEGRNSGTKDRPSSRRAFSSTTPTHARVAPPPELRPSRRRRRRPRRPSGHGDGPAPFPAAASDGGGDGGDDGGGGGGWRQHAQERQGGRRGRQVLVSTCRYFTIYL